MHAAGFLQGLIFAYLVDKLAILMLINSFNDEQPIYDAPCTSRNCNHSQGRNFPECQEKGDGARLKPVIGGKVISQAIFRQDGLLPGSSHEVNVAWQGCSCPVIALLGHIRHLLPLAGAGNQDIHALHPSLTIVASKDEHSLFTRKKAF